MKGPRVLFVSRPNLISQPGGDTLHLQQNRVYLQKSGVSTSLWDGSQDLAEFDLIHFYGLTRPAALMPLLKSELPIIVSSIYVDYSIADRKASRLRARLQQLIGQNGLEYLKLIARALKGRDAWPGISYLLEGQSGSIRKILDRCDYLITASESELGLIVKEYPFAGNHKVIRLGTEHLPPLNPAQEKKDVLCVARIEPLKNQAKLIEAQTGSNWKLHLVGDAAPAHQGYLKHCKSLAGPKVLFHADRNHEECASMYNKAKVHVLPSHYESTGLASLEALHFGCQIVVNNHPIARELFGDKAFYANVEKADSIREAIQKALEAQEDHRKWLHDHFSWADAAHKILAIYRKVLTSRAWKLASSGQEESPTYTGASKSVLSI